MDGMFHRNPRPRGTDRAQDRARPADGLTARLVLDETGFREAQALRYEAYLEAGYLAPKDDLLFSDSYDARSDSRTLVLYSEGDPAASVRVCALGAGGDESAGGDLPASAMFRDEIEACLGGIETGGRGPVAVEIIRLARSPRHSRNVALVMGLYHLATYMTLYFRADMIFAAVTTNHAPFYRRMGFRQIAAPKDYPRLSVQTVLMRCLFDEHRGIPGRTLALRDMSRNDDTYLGLIAGEEVPVFGSLTGLDAGRAAGPPARTEPAALAAVLG